MTREEIKAALDKQAEEMAQKEVDWFVDCNCNPDHIFYEGGICWYHMEEGDKYELAFSQGARSRNEMILELIEALQDIKSEGHSSNCTLMKPYRSHYYCTEEIATEALNKLYSDLGVKK